MKKTETMNVSAAVLWASAFVIAAMVIVQAGRLPGNPAHADMAIAQDEFTLLTTRYGSGDNKILYVINSRDQVLLIYEVENARENIMTFREGLSLVQLFRVGRGG
jgi:hypothetical protein